MARRPVRRPTEELALARIMREQARARETAAEAELRRRHEALLRRARQVFEEN